MDGLLKSYQVENLSYTTMSVLLHCVQSPVKPFSFLIRKFCWCEDSHNIINTKMCSTTFQCRNQSIYCK